MYILFYTIIGDKISVHFCHLFLISSSSHICKNVTVTLCLSTHELSVIIRNSRHIFPMHFSFNISISKNPACLEKGMYISIAS